MTKLTVTMAKHRRLYGLIILVLYIAVANPSAISLYVGVPLMILGMLYRVWSSGYIFKDNSLAVEGPYSIVRNPLYFGSYIMGAGCVAAGNVWWLTAAYLVTYPIVYYCLILTEEERLTELFGEDYSQYLRDVPRLIPRPWKYKKTEATWSFKLTFIEHKEYATGLGILIITGFLVLRVCGWLHIFNPQS